MSDERAEILTLLEKDSWNAERKRLREILLEAGLDEGIRWGKLCYSFSGANVAIIFGLKTYCAVGFLKGSLLRDHKGLLVSPGKHSQAMRQMRFSGMAEIDDAEHDLRDYVKGAIQLEIDGAQVDFSAKNDMAYPDELRDRLDQDPEFAEAFADLTPGRQRGYIIHFSEAKQSKTRQARIARCRSRIIEGIGLNERGVRPSRAK